MSITPQFAAAPKTNFSIRALGTLLNLIPLNFCQLSFILSLYACFCEACDCRKQLLGPCFFPFFDMTSAANFAYYLCNSI